MSRRHDRARASSRGSGRHSNLMSGGRGEPRDHRREDQRITDNDLDEQTLEIDTKGRLTVKPDVATAAVAGLFNSIEAIVDNTAGTVSPTLPSIPDPADTPASADALRDDLVANTLPPIRDALASLSNKLNAILSSASTPRT